MVVFLLINVKMPTVVGILTFLNRKNFMLNWVEHDFFITSGPGIHVPFCKTDEKRGDKIRFNILQKQWDWTQGLTTLNNTLHTVTWYNNMIQK